MSRDAYPAPETVIRAGLTFAGLCALALLALRRGARHAH